MAKTIKDGSELIEQMANADAPKLDPRVVELATKVYELALSKLISHNQFLAAPLTQVNLEFTQLTPSIVYMSEGDKLLVDPYQFLKRFEQSQLPPQRELVHVLLHFILLHPFVGVDINQRLWNVACDMVVENLIIEILPDDPDPDREAKKEALLKVSSHIEKTLTAEKLYRLFKDGLCADEIEVYEKLFFVDSHDLWYQRVDSEKPQQKPSQQPQNNPSSQDDSSSSGDAQQSYTAADGDEEGDTSSGESPETPPAQPSFTQEQINELEESWQKAAKSMKVDLETISKASGERLSGLLKELEVSTHEVIDYREFLRQFAVKNEDMRLSDDEFDYIFYTYGLELYEDMPLIEPLEYRTNNEIRDFCIVIDTSSSVTGSVVQEFINTTFDVLASENTYAKKVNIHIIQCDNAVQSDTKITSVNEINQWAQNFKLKGFGGTDFRPAFKYINELYHSGEFNDLGGVIYFTDGWGVYPDRMPPYKTAFCFYDEDCRPELVPPWAIQLVLHPGQLDGKTVYA